VGSDRGRIQFNYPFKIDESGRSAIVDEGTHIRQLVEQVLFTAMGERVNRATFGTGINQLVFAPNSDQLATATQFLVQGALQQWLGNLIRVELVSVQNIESSLTISIQYTIIKNQERQTQTLTKEI
jgi:phage baseplate assembly protein W